MASTYRLNNKEKIIDIRKKYLQNSIHKLRESQKKYRLNNNQKIKQIKKDWYQKNKIRVKEKSAYRQKLSYLKHKERLNSDPVYRLKRCVSTKLPTMFKHKGWKKNSSSEKLIGCSFEFAKKWIEKKFKSGMSWENYGKWHIDHIIPLASAKTEVDLISLCHYTNLQPLWAIDNIQKRDKILATQISLLI